MLKAAGVENLETDLWWMPVQRPYNPNAKRMAEMMQADLAKVGINAKLVSYEWGEYRKRLQAGEHQMGLLGWTGDNGDPDNFLLPAAAATGAREGEPKHPEVVQPEFEDKLQQGGRSFPTRPTAPSSTRRCRSSPRTRCRGVNIAHSTVFEPIRKEVVGLQGQPLRRATNSTNVDVAE